MELSGNINFPPTDAICRFTVKGLKTLILFKDEVKEMDFLFKAQTEKNDIQFKEKAKTMNGRNGSAVTFVTLEV